MCHVNVVVLLKTNLGLIGIAKTILKTTKRYQPNQTKPNQTKPNILNPPAKTVLAYSALR